MSATAGAINHNALYHASLYHGIFHSSIFSDILSWNVVDFSAPSGLILLYIKSHANLDGRLSLGSLRSCEKSLRYVYALSCNGFVFSFTKDQKLDMAHTVSCIGLHGNTLSTVSNNLLDTFFHASTISQNGSDANS
jgi:hypothetical protein